MSAIRQRKLLLQTNRSRKSQPETYKALEILDRLLSTYTYENDVYMARFIIQNQDNIVMILPGAGASGHERKKAEFGQMCKEAIMIIDNAGEERRRVQYLHFTERDQKI